ncbi:MAG: phosphoribosylaminoimidazolesuccinocarboxamide synthase [Calditrichaeota bacterium]|nr:phosphoribosylaminoimidazolesuccinocarboxamide synthase [Calditrichota bacterium]
MKKGELLYEGKAKKLYATDNPDMVIQEFKDDATAFNGKKKGTIKDKGVVNNKISAFIFEFLESYHVPTHFEKVLSDREMLVKKLDIIPVEVVMRNIATGSLVKRYGLEEGKELDYPVLEFYLKDDELNDPMINEHHAVAFGLATPDEMETISRYATKINAILKSFFIRRKIRLIDFKLEFGRFKDRILLGDEISPDTCRFWDLETGEKLDKDRFRQDLGRVEEAYQEMLNRILHSGI